MRLTSILALTLGLFACRSNNNPPGADSPNIAGAVTIQQVQSDSMAPGTAVILQGVVVTAIDTFGAKTGDIWVEEPAGGPFSGVHVYNAPVSVVATLTVGDIVDISGAIKSEFALTGSGADTTGRTETELEPATGGTMTVTKTGTGSVPAAATVDALSIGEMYDASMASTNGGGTAFNTAWRMWDGVLVTTSNVSALSAPKAFGSTTPTPADNYDFSITGVAKVEGNFVDITSESIARNSCLSVTGVVSYFYDYLLLPRTTADLGTGTSCPAAETVCNDNIDNDGNGYADCADDNCIITASACHTAETIATLDAAADANPATPTLPTGGVVITGACVVATSGTNMYIAANGTAATDGGIYVYGAGQALPTGVVGGATNTTTPGSGSTVDVVGTVSAFKSTGSTATEGELEIAQLLITKDNPTCTTTPKALNGANASIATLSMDANGHPLIGSLVTLTPTSPFKLTTAVASHFGKLTSGSTVVAVGTSMLGSAYTADAVGTCYNSLTGIWTYDTTGAGSYEILLTTAPAAGGNGTSCTGA